MTIVHFSSILHRITKGEFEGRVCNVMRYYFRDTNLNQAAEVVFADYDCNDFATIKVEHLSEIDPPGRIMTDYEKECPYGLGEYFSRQKGSGSNMLRTLDLAHPRALRVGDELSTGEIVTEEIRRGYNSSVLVRLDKAGWVELAPRLPIALKGNVRFKLPMELVENDRLVTGCLIAKGSDSTNDNWIGIYLNRKSCRIEVPFCVPLALE